jgi:two-component system phosphate regulon sensor histidine kinase PhoR
VLAAPLLTAVFLLSGALVLLLGPYRHGQLRDASAEAQERLRVLVAQIEALGDPRVVLDATRSDSAPVGIFLVMNPRGDILFDSRSGWFTEAEPLSLAWPTHAGAGALRRPAPAMEHGRHYLRAEYRWGTQSVGGAIVHLISIDGLNARLIRLALTIAGLWALATGAMTASLASLARRLGRERRDLIRTLAILPEGEPFPASGEEEVLDLDRYVREASRRALDNLAALKTEIRERDAVLRDMHEGVVAVNTRRDVVLINPAAERMLGIPRDSGKGLRVAELVRSGAFQSLVEDVLEREAAVESEIDLEGGARRLRALGDVLRGPDGVSQGAVLVMGDVTEIRRLERIRRDFVANVSHELKTPITAIQGYVDTILEGGGEVDDAVRQRFLRIVSTNVHRMHRILEDLLQLSRVESVGDDIDRTWFDPCALARRTLGDVRLVAERRSIRFVLEGDEAPQRIHANETLLERAIGNLLDNAVKYGPEGSTVTLRIREEAPSEMTGAAGPMVRFEVRDEGPGIPAPHLQRLFERFYRVDKGRSRELGGTGLGLAIAKHIAIAHGGSVGVESTLGSGSIFFVRIPGGPP